MIAIIADDCLYLLFTTICILRYYENSLYLIILLLFHLYLYKTITNLYKQIKYFILLMMYLDKYNKLHIEHFLIMKI